MNRENKIGKIVIASDHAGFELKQSLIEAMRADGVEVTDLGPDSSEQVDYPDYGIKVATMVSEDENLNGIVMCGTGIGMSIVVNRFPKVRGTLCNDMYTAKLCRQHNDSNILIMGGRVIGMGLAYEIVRTWMSTPFEGGRHGRRLEKINNIQNMLNKGVL
ncbi:Ribose-5-phosphate isomerase B [Nitrospina gracilis 3/211]|uniref:Ribose-5-phosphate isomerase B n=1 Tax=Nitrospina gracilis (strain 3/211) TaxID=1266370 RepID=M1YM11_NITG3|nr:MULTISPECIES: ribose 5-phosphate isomerase B [Nitrospina]MCF8724367.1 ribose 5-phosphate isomerase B [Nitrospina sp. Nb-3]CCQ91521.1 Ribose-5-phosphate isomerase B [Nitrospina gracilis 3/211]